MTSCFKPDIFSLPKPKWHSVDSETAPKVLKITSAMGLVIGDTLPEQVIGQEINSNNYRLKLADGKVVVLKASATHASSSYRDISEHFLKMAFLSLDRYLLIRTTMRFRMMDLMEFK